ncbi:SDR family NAD(P)-dependent oxidoreductase [Sinomicrobium soli]|uniref:SDR family NAD(P)-dependent oxidoreductase n=1 Tax=Sinomicrobium sp. N-1-3-6 TaxID=2219864 RepID=UPI000DCC4091|nr:SDR family NAD(P)-dependent oxidoreductase [Sinomicrobium sp. N-1-3-6]RAV29453.1 NAD(P)-dependent oxidoreductase [Sinomicrobium sp. N-1-3-6]
MHKEKGVDKDLTAFITGATSGIGRATAQVFARQGIRLVLCGRRQERLENLKLELSGFTDVHVLQFDVSNRDDVFEAVNSLPERFSEIGILINNAGNAHGLDPIQEGDVDDWDAMIDSNVKGLLYVSRAILPQMVRRKRGHVIHVGSIAAKEVYANGGVYCASKHAVDAISKGMRIDLNAYGIRVGAIHPGMVETEFSRVRFKGDTERADAVYSGIEALTAEDVAEIIYFMVSRPPHVNIADLLVLPLAQASASVTHRE